MKRNLIAKIAFIVSVMVSAGCMNDGPHRQVVRSGLNGDAYYHINKSGEVTSVAKPEYVDPGNFMVTINQDSIATNSKFKGFFIVWHSNFTVYVEEPSMAVISGTPAEKTEEAHQYVYEALQPGQYRFRGRIEYDTVMVKFEYKFVVLLNN